MSNQFIVTITPPTPNGDLHIGHIAGPYMAADIFTRAQRLQGGLCYLVSYSDDYQSYLTRKALELGVDAVQLAHENSAKIQESLRMVGIDVDHWLESHGNPHFEWSAKMLYEQGQASGLIRSAHSEAPYCEHCQVWGYEGFARGSCNHCGASSDASQCEACAMAPEAAKMADLKCILCHAPMGMRPVQRQFLAFDQVADALRRRLDAAPMRGQLRRWLDHAFEQGLGDWGVTRPGESGLKLYDDEAHRLHTWFMGQAGYFAALKELSERDEAADAYGLLSSANTCVVNFLGMDCSFSHVLAYPAQVLGNPAFKFSQAFYTNAFLKLDGDDFSTSRGHAIWVRDLVSDACADSVRFYVSLIAPEEQTGNFSVDDFWAWRRRVFEAVLPHVHRELARGGARASGRLPAFERAVAERWLHCASAAHFSMKGMAEQVMTLVEAIEAELRHGPVRRELLVLFAVLCGPTMPGLGRALAGHVPEAERMACMAELGLGATQQEACHG